jgi:acyl-CoA thioester hydrolase
MIYKKNIELRYSDSDQMGVVYHANYFTFFEQSRTGFLKELGVDYYDLEANGYIFPVRDVNCTYLKSIRLGEEVYCETMLVEQSKVKLVFGHVIKNNEGEIKAKGNTCIICVRKEDFRICKMDQAIPTVYQIIKGL